MLSSPLRSSNSAKSHAIWDDTLLLAASTPAEADTQFDDSGGMQG